jgi:hypothetical protein
MLINLHKFSASNVLALLKLADRYQCQLLRDRCEAHLVNCIEIPLEDLLTTVELYGLKNLMVFLSGLLESKTVLKFAYPGKTDDDFPRDWSLGFCPTI